MRIMNSKPKGYLNKQFGLPTPAALLKVVSISFAIAASIWLPHHQYTTRLSTQNLSLISRSTTWQGNNQIGSNSPHQSVEDMRNFLDWYKSSGGFVNKISITTTKNMGKGIVAIENIENEDLLLKVPISIIICRKTIFKQPLQHDIRTKLSQLESDIELLTAFILLEMRKGSASRWHKYFQLLPSAESHQKNVSPLFYPLEDDIQELQDETMIQNANDEKNKIKIGFRRFMDRFAFQFSTHSNPIMQVEESYRWVQFLLNSRAFTLKGARFLVPFADFFNGKPGARKANQRRHENGASFANHHYFVKERSIEYMLIRADREVNAQQEVFEDYGDNSNYIYFLYHGFLMQNNQNFDCTSIKLPSVKNKEKILALEKMQLQDRLQLCLPEDGKIKDDYFMRMLDIYMMVYHMKSLVLQKCNVQRVSPRNYFLCLFPHGLQHTDISDYKRCSFINDAIDSALRSYKTTLNEDQIILGKINAHNNSSNALRNAIKFRTSRKQIILNAKVVMSKCMERSNTLQSKVQTSTTNLKERINDKQFEVAEFNRWIQSRNFPTNFVELKYISDDVGYGVVATKSLKPQEVYLGVPTDSVMNINSASKNLWIQDLLNYQSKTSLHRDTKLNPSMILALHLLYEKFGPYMSKSVWRPYLNVLPSADTLKQKSHAFNNTSQLKLLDGVDIYSTIQLYQQRIYVEYNNIHILLQMWMNSTSTNMNFNWLTEYRYKWATAILDSRSIWWHGQRNLVPLLDMVNCEEKDPKQDLHETKAMLMNMNGKVKEVANTKATWEFSVGDQIIENYGQPNYIYLLYHGFVLGNERYTNNSYDCAHFHFSLDNKLLSRKKKQQILFALQRLKVYEWVSDICVYPNNPASVDRFQRIAVIYSSPKDFHDIYRYKESVRYKITKDLIQQKIAALELARDRILKAIETTPSSKLLTYSTYVHQQLQHLDILLKTITSYET